MGNFSGKSLVRKSSALALMVVLLAQLAACGTLMYPERRGQKVSGRIDPQVAILNGIGLLFAVVPGVLAFAVDFVTGAIYLPNNKTALLLDPETMRSIKVDGKIDAVLIEQIIKREMGVDVDLEAENVQLQQLESVGQLGEMSTLALPTNTERKVI